MAGYPGNGGAFVGGDGAAKHPAMSTAIASASKLPLGPRRDYGHVCSWSLSEFGQERGEKRFWGARKHELCVAFVACGVERTIGGRARRSRRWLDCVSRQPAWLRAFPPLRRPIGRGRRSSRSPALLA